MRWEPVLCGCVMSLLMFPLLFSKDFRLNEGYLIPVSSQAVTGFVESRTGKHPPQKTLRPYAVSLARYAGVKEKVEAGLCSSEEA